MIPSGTTKNQTVAISGTRKYIFLSDKIDECIRYMELGALFGVPFVMLFFNKNYALAIFAMEIVSYVIGVLVINFQQWYNSQNDKSERREGFNEYQSPEPSELSITLNRLQYFTDKYGIAPGDMYFYLERDVIPFDNLDWMEVVGLLNQLSLFIGKRFENEKSK